MKMNKEKFLKTELGAEMKNCIDCWDLYLNKDFESAKLCQAQWEVYQMSIKQFYGIEYHFTRTDEYYGIVTEDYNDWLYKVEKTQNETPRVGMYEKLIKLGYTSEEAWTMISEMNFVENC